MSDSLKTAAQAVVDAKRTGRSIVALSGAIRGLEDALAADTRDEVLGAAFSPALMRVVEAASVAERSVLARGSEAVVDGGRIVSQESWDALRGALRLARLEVDV